MPQTRSQALQDVLEHGDASTQFLHGVDLFKKALAAAGFRWSIENGDCFIPKDEYSSLIPPDMVEQARKLRKGQSEVVDELFFWAHALFLFKYLFGAFFISECV